MACITTETVMVWICSVPVCAKDGCAVLLLPASLLCRCYRACCCSAFCCCRVCCHCCSSHCPSDLCCAVLCSALCNFEGSLLSPGWELLSAVVKSCSILFFYCLLFLSGVGVGLEWSSVREWFFVNLELSHTLLICSRPLLIELPCCQ
jgi:hypothetical protein